MGYWCNFNTPDFFDYCHHDFNRCARSLNDGIYYCNQWRCIMTKNDFKDIQPFLEALANGKTILYEIEYAKWVELERYYFSAPVEKYRIEDSQYTT